MGMTIVKEQQSKRMASIMHCLSCLPRKILELQGRENIIEFILHELGREECFNLERVAYVVDNPDFDCIKGVAGYCRLESYHPQKDIWQEADDFSQHMKNSSFNNKIRCFCKPSGIKCGISEQDIIKEIATELGFSHPSYYAWQVKHDNKGILLYEKAEEGECDCEYLLDGLCLIGFCPIF